MPEAVSSRPTPAGVRMPEALTAGLDLDDPAQRAVLGWGVPEPVEHHLRAAARCYHQDDLAERHLRKAQAMAPDHAAVLIALYRFYFYKNRLAEALQIAERCLRKAAADNRLCPDWRAVRAGDATFDSYEAVLPRFYLFTLKGYAYLQMRLGNVDEGREALMKLLELDPADKLGGRVLIAVLNRMGISDGD
jgi:tetratricopeptide (TPR) repeat protein